MEHYRIGSTIAILSRSFCNADEIKDIRKIDMIFAKNMKSLRDFEQTLVEKSDEEYLINKKQVARKVKEIVRLIKEK